MTRRVFALITALCLVFGMMPAVFAAETVTGTRGIPWYPYTSEITAVVVEEGVTTIGEAAFYSCGNLSELALPSTLTSIGQYAFSYCSISELALPDGLLSLGIIAFFMPASDLYLDVYFVSEGSPFKDVKESDYFYAPVLWAVSRGVTTGVGNGRFAPNDSCTRGQVVTFLFRFLY